MSSACEAHVWSARVPDSDRTDGTERWLPLLSAAERSRTARFHFAQNRAQYAVAHGLLRAALSWCVPEVPPRAWEFCSGSCGRPELTGRPAKTELRFSLSHTRGLSACVVTRELDCGIDVESAASTGTEPFQRRVLTPAEYTALTQLPADERQLGFLRYWAATLLELARKVGRRHGVELRMEKRMTHEELSEMVGTTRSRVGFFLKRFSDDGLLVQRGSAHLAVNEPRMARYVAMT